jgi:hypothetical protein
LLFWRCCASWSLRNDGIAGDQVRNSNRRLLAASIVEADGQGWVSERHDEIGDEQTEACRRRQARESRRGRALSQMTAIRCFGETSRAGWRRAPLGHAQCLALDDISQTHHRSFSAHTPVCFPSHPYFLPACQLTPPTTLQSLLFIFSTLLSFRRHVVSPTAPLCEAARATERHSKPS